MKGHRTRALTLLTPLIPSPWDAAAFLDRVGAATGRTVHLHRVPLPPAGPRGVWIPAAGVDHIVIAERMPPIQEAAVVFHEVGHLVLGHTPPHTAAGHTEAAAALLDVLAALTIPDLDPTLAVRFLGRNHYDTRTESEAEDLATRLIQRMQQIGTTTRDTLGALNDQLL